MSQGPGGPPRWPPGSGLPPGHPANTRTPSPFRGPPPPRPGWASPIPPRMTQSPPPFLIRPMVGGQRGTASPVPSSPVPFMPPPPRWSPSPVPTGGASTPVPFGHPPPPHMMAPRPFFRPIIPSPTPPPPQMGNYSSPTPQQFQYTHQQYQQQMQQQYQHYQQTQSQTPLSPSQHLQQDEMGNNFDLQPSYDIEIVYPAGMDPDAVRRRMTPQMSVDEGEDGPTTAEIIAAQSQDYVDERLAEYQATIQHLQGFTNTKFFIISSFYCFLRKYPGLKNNCMKAQGFG